MTKEGSFELTYQCLREFQYEFAPVNSRIIKYGEIGDKFYIIWKGWVDVYIPSEKKVNFTSLELNRLIEGYREFIIEINGNTHFSTSSIHPHQRTQYSKITLEAVLDKLFELNAVDGK